MKTVSIPAQITSVEDRIVGGLTLAQLGLIAAPVFIDFAIYVALPRPMKLNIYKICLIFLISSFLLILALRLKGKLVLFWLLTLISFRVRPKLFVYDKNTLAYRTALTSESRGESATSTLQEAKGPEPVKQDKYYQPKSSHKISFIEERKGKLHVYVGETI